MGKVLPFKRPDPPSVEPEDGKEILAVKTLTQHFSKADLEAIRADLETPLTEEPKP